MAKSSSRAVFRRIAAEEHPIAELRHIAKLYPSRASFWLLAEELFCHKGG